MAKIAEVVEGSEEPLFFDLEINGASFDVDDYDVEEMTATLTNGSEVTIAGTLTAAGTVAHPSRVKFTPNSADFAHGAGALPTLPLEAEKYWVRFWLTDADDVLLSFPRGVKDWIEVFAA